jgi:hypothetical protein
MSKYLCETCKQNNNGWCKEHKINGLKAKNIQKCDSFSKPGTAFVLERESKDYYGQDMVSVKINNEIVCVPMIVLEKFINDKDMKKQEVNIPD